MKREVEAYVSSNLFKVGIGNVVVARFRGSGEVEVGVFLVDVYCLGVKDAFYVRVDRTEYESLLDSAIKAEDRERFDPPSARKLVEGAVAYAENLGLPPHPDYKKAGRVFGGINAAESTASFIYGKNGKPLYIQGPRDSLQFCRRVVNQLRRRCGDGGFNFILSLTDEGIAELERSGFRINQASNAQDDSREQTS